MNLGVFIREKRQEKNMSQRDLAASAGISNAEISRIEAQKRKSPSPSVLKLIAKALNISIEDIYTCAGILEESQSSIETLAQSSEEFTVPKLFVTSSPVMMPSDLTEDEIKEVMRYIDFIRSKREK